MSGNTFGQLFTLTTFGESHGPAIGGIIDGCPPGLSLSVEDIQHELDRRKPGATHYTSQRSEEDKIQILSGVFDGVTTGTPIGLLINNCDVRSKDYEEIKNKFRPGHADYTYYKKYGIRDHRGGGRSSARETALWVAGGAIAKKYLALQGISIIGYVAQIGDIIADPIDISEANNNPFYFPNAEKIPELEHLIQQIRRDGDSIGARVTVIASGMPVGLGEPVFAKLDADIAAAMVGINAAKAVAIGAGFDCVTQRGSEHRDEITPNGFLSNNAGGTLGGISSGQDIVINVAFKPTSSIRIPANTIDTNNNACEIVTTGRHDPCVGIRAVPVAEAMLALVLMDHHCRHRAQCVDAIKQHSANL